MRALLDSDALETSPTCVPSDQRRVDCGPRHGNGGRPGVGGSAFRSRERHRVVATGWPEPIGAHPLDGKCVVT